MHVNKTATILWAISSLGVSAANADVNVVTSIKPVHSLVSGVMQGVGSPTVIIEGAGSPHTYSLKPSQAKQLQDADLVFWMGDELETFLEGPIQNIAKNAKSNIFFTLNIYFLNCCWLIFNFVITFAPATSKHLFQERCETVLWCNWQHVGFWYRRVQVRALVGQQSRSFR